MKKKLPKKKEKQPKKKRVTIIVIEEMGEVNWQNLSDKFSKNMKK